LRNDKYGREGLIRLSHPNIHLGCDGQGKEGGNDLGDFDRLLRNGDRLLDPGYHPLMV
jgi:hypothetical protein